jgi:hypothetical protein
MLLLSNSHVHPSIRDAEAGLFVSCRGCCCVPPPGMYLLSPEVSFQLFAFNPECGGA